MKRKTIIHASIAGTAMAFMVAGTIAGISLFEKKVEKTDAYTVQSITSIKNIDLNDAADSTIRNYYSSLNSLSTNERKGTNLLKNLKPILKNGQKYYKYNDGSPLWPMYEITDRDWSKSPASAISGYNASTNTITNYSYGSSASNPGMNPYIHALYVRRTDNNLMHAWARESDSAVSHGNNKEWGFDQEHIWAKSQGFESDGSNGKGGVRGDPMHLWPGDSDVNSSLHNDQMYGYVNITSSTKRGKWSYATDNYVGTSLTLGTSLSTEDVFEPQDSDKGDIARAIFYLVARYNYLSGEDEDGIDGSNPNLELVQDNTVRTGYTASTTNTGKQGILTDLLAWNRLDPPDEFEIHRNNLLFNNYTKNRNPFIDFPEWAEYIWGKPTYNNRNLQSYNNIPTGYAIPTADKINQFGNAVTTPTITLNKTSAALPINGTVQLTATAMGGTGNVTWSTSSSSVTQLSATSGDSIVVTGKANGTATITASYSGKTATCTVTVSATLPTVTSVTVNPSTLSLDLNGTATGNLSATVNGTNSPSQTVTWSSTNSNIATVSANGVVTAVDVGTATIKATSTIDDTKYGSCTVTVVNSAGSSSGTFTIGLKDGSLSSSTSYVTTETTKQDYNGGDATATVVFNQLNGTSGQLKGNQSTASNLQAGSNFYIRNTSALPGNIREIKINGMSVSGGSKPGSYTPSKSYAKTGTSAVSSQSISDSTAGAAGSDGTSIVWSFTGNSGKYFGISCEQGFTSYSVYGTTITVSYEGSSGSLTPAVTAVDVSPTKVLLTAGGESKQLTASVSVENNADDSVVWTSSNTNVATVSSYGEVTPVSAGTATITATSVFNTSKSGSATVTVNAVSTVTNSPYMNGVPYYMYVSVSSKNNYFTGGTAGSNNQYGATSDKINSAQVVFFEKNGSGQNIYFVNASGEKKYVTVAPNGSYINFTLATTASATPWIYNTSSNCLTFEYNNSTYYMGSTGTFTTLSIYTENPANQIIFESSSSGAAGLATIILNNVVCNSNGTSAPTFSSLSAWSQLSNIYSNISEVDKEELSSIEADENGSLLERAVAKYDYIVGKYGTATYANFLNRAVINNSNKLGKTIVSNNAMLLLVVMATLGTFTFAAWFIYKKKQYDL